MMQTLRTSSLSASEVVPLPFVPLPLPLAWHWTGPLLTFKEHFEAVGITCDTTRRHGEGRDARKAAGWLRVLKKGLETQLVEADDILDH